MFDACYAHNKKAVYIAVGNYWMNDPYSITKTSADQVESFQSLTYTDEVDLDEKLAKWERPPNLNWFEHYES